jgi:hypothetical protein
VDCQSRGYLQCRTRVEGGCEVACTEPDGALFCDGQYVDHGGNLQECIDALRAAYDIEVTASGSATSDCADNRCEGSAEGSASASCSLDGAPGAGRDGTSASGVATLRAAAAVCGSRLRRRR